jgi:hypothetical protein
LYSLCSPVCARLSLCSPSAFALTCGCACLCQCSLLSILPSVHSPCSSLSVLISVCTRLCLYSSLSVLVSVCARLCLYSSLSGPQMGSRRTVWSTNGVSKDCLVHRWGLEGLSGPQMGSRRRGQAGLIRWWLISSQRHEWIGGCSPSNLSPRCLVLRALHFISMYSYSHGQLATSSFQQKM